MRCFNLCFFCPTTKVNGIACTWCFAFNNANASKEVFADNNVALFVLLPALAVVWWRWLASSWKGLPAASVSGAPSSRLLIAVLIAVSIFGVVRNFVPYLGSGIG
jgi:hypothetical protein